MKRRFVTILLATAMTLAMMGCGNGGKTNKESEERGQAQTQENEADAVATEKTEDGDEAEPIQAVADESGNYVVNGSFEEADFTGWTVNNVNDATEELDIYTRATDCYDGEQSLHFYSGSNVVDFTVEQSLTGLEAGTYKFSAYCQGDTAGDADGKIYFYIMADGETYNVDGQLNGYVNWYCAEQDGISITGGDATIGVCVQNAAGGWGTIDAISLVKEQ